MKDSKEYSGEIRRLYNSLRRKYPKVQEKVYEEPVESLVYAVISENTTESFARSVMKKISNYFIDMNDLRVSRMEEIVEVMAENTEVTRDAASSVTNMLRGIFYKHNTVSLKILSKIGKRPARKRLEELESVSDFVINYCMLTALSGHAIPLTARMVEYLQNSELVHPDADEREIEGFLTRQISAKKAYEFYYLLRRESESRKSTKRKKSTRKTKKEKTTNAKKKVKQAKKR